MDTSWSVAYFAANQTVISVTISTVKGTCAEHLVKLGLSGNDKVYLVPVFGPVMSPRRYMVELSRKESAGMHMSVKEQNDGNHDMYSDFSTWGK